MKIETFSISIAYNDLPRTINAECVVIEPCFVAIEVREHFFTLSFVSPSKSETGEGELLLSARRKNDTHTQYTWRVNDDETMRKSLYSAVEAIGQGMHPTSHSALYESLRPHFYLVEKDNGFCIEVGCHDPNPA